MSKNMEKLIRYLNNEGQYPENISIVTGVPLEIVNQVIEGKRIGNSFPEEKPNPVSSKKAEKLEVKSLCKRNSTIRQLADKGYSKKELAEKYILPESSIRTILAGKTPWELKEERNLEMLRLFEKGETKASLSEKFELSYAQVHKICSKGKGKKRVSKKQKAKELIQAKPSITTNELAIALSISYVYASSLLKEFRAKNNQRLIAFGRVVHIAEYQAMDGKGGYEAVADSWGLTGGMIWRMINEPGYWPANPEIRRRIVVKAREKGIEIKKRGRKRDLYSLDPRVLRWMLDNRVEVRRKGELWMRKKKQGYRIDEEDT